MTTTTRGVVDSIDDALRQNEDKDSPPIFAEVRAANGEGGKSGDGDVPRRRGRRAAAETESEATPAEERPFGMKSFTTRHVPWMQIGHVTERAKNARQAAKLGGLDFNVELLEAGFKLEKQTKPGEPLWRTVGARRACVHAETKQFLSFVSATYTPVQFTEAFDFMDEISPLYVAAGTLSGGRQGFIVAQLPEESERHMELKIGRVIDPLDLYVICRTSHDLTRAVEVSVMMLRGKCMNALSFHSFTSHALHRWSVKHVGTDPMEKLRAAALTRNRVHEYADAFRNTAKLLAGVQLEIEDARHLLERILPNKPKRDDQVNSIVTSWRESPTNGFPTNGWGLVNAVGEYFDWGRPDGTRTDQSRFTSGLNGQTHKFVNRTAQLILQRR